MPVPAAVFAPARRPTFALFDDRSREVPIGPSFADDADGVVYIAHDDLPDFSRYVLKHLHAIASNEELKRRDVAWAIHHALSDETTRMVEARAGRYSAGTLSWLAYEAAAFVLRDTESFAFLDAIVDTQYSVVSHAVETALYAVTIAAADGLDDDDALQAITLAGIFADSGKLALPEALLAKDGPLNDDEWAAMQRHPKLSVEYMHKAGIVSRLAQQGVLHHHERWDGTGYPDRLSRRAIPMEARYVAIADAYAALTVDRVFSERRDPYEALVAMLTNRGQFEPRLLRVFVPLLLVDSDEDDEEDWDELDDGDDGGEADGGYGRESDGGEAAGTDAEAVA
jgi:HD-GYP domain-containing protein (c-di-GMP phosphodiesterase class II)